MEYSLDYFIIWCAYFRLISCGHYTNNEKPSQLAYQRDGSLTWLIIWLWDPRPLRSLHREFKAPSFLFSVSLLFISLQIRVHSWFFNLPNKLYTKIINIISLLTNIIKFYSILPSTNFNKQQIVIIYNVYFTYLFI